MDSKQRKHYRLIRYDYYQAGRILHLMGNFHSAGIMLGYTIETQMKAGLMEVLSEEEQNKNRILNSSHDVIKIFNECKKYKLFSDIQVSNDFLEHVNYHFQRYPSQKRKTLVQASSQNKVIGNSQDWVYYYDDLIVQLDCALYKISSDPYASIICLVLQSLETRNSRDILYRNIHALLQFNNFIEVIRQIIPQRQDLKKQIEENFSKGIIFYWDPDMREEISTDEIITLAKKYKSYNFRLPLWNPTNGGIGTIIP